MPSSKVYFERTTYFCKTNTGGLACKIHKPYSDISQGRKVGNLAVSSGHYEDGLWHLRSSFSVS